MEKTHALVLIGPMGAGKSVVGAHVAQRLGWRLVDIDTQVERQHGMSVADMFSRDGEAVFRAAESAALLDALAMRDVVVATGGGAVLAARNRDAMRAAGIVVHLHADVATQRARLQADTSRPLLEVPDRDARLRALADVRGPLYADLAAVRIDTSLMSLDDVIDATVDALQAVRA